MTNRIPNRLENKLLILKFKLKIYEVDGNEFQKLFGKIMRYKHGAEFRYFAQYRSDGGNDGFVPSKGVYFQCYGPVSGSQATGISKAHGDFEKLLKNWNEAHEIQEFHFAINDKFSGETAELHKSVQEIKVKNFLRNASIYTSNDLLDDFSSLKFSEKEEIVGGLDEIRETLDISFFPKRLLVNDPNEAIKQFACWFQELTYLIAKSKSISKELGVLLRVKSAEKDFADHYEIIMKCIAKSEPNRAYSVVFARKLYQSFLDFAGENLLNNPQIGVAKDIADQLDGLAEQFGDTEYINSAKQLMERLEDLNRQASKGLKPPPKWFSKLFTRIEIYYDLEKSDRYVLKSLACETAACFREIETEINGAARLP